MERCKSYQTVTNTPAVKYWGPEFDTLFETNFRYSYICMYQNQNMCFFLHCDVFSCWYSESNNCLSTNNPVSLSVMIRFSFTDHRACIVKCIKNGH